MTPAAASMPTAVVTAAPPPPPPLPRLREDLKLIAGAMDAKGRPTWRVYDPLRHRYIAIDDMTRAAFAVWSGCRTLEELRTRLCASTRSTCSSDDIAALVRFCSESHLTEPSSPDQWKKERMAAAARRHGIVMTLVHNYLFFRCPLVAPEPWLSRFAPAIAILFHRRFQQAVLGLGVVGLYVASRQWDTFTHHAAALATPSGLALLGITLFVVKIFHELGHAIVAHRYGCRVPTIGIAVMLMAPMLYADVTDSWKLEDRRKRLAIDCAGVAVECALACICTFLWAFLPDGTLRTAMFFVATTSLMMSVAVNLNPFMRFDGYYILSDLIGIENLQTRAFDLGAWRLREILFAPGVAPPEHLSQRMTRGLVAYAWSVWLYRVVLFTGIALAVYHYFFKALGIALFLFEIGYFIVRPLISEVKHWWEMRSVLVRSRRKFVTALCVSGLILAAVVPWPTQVEIPAVLEAREIARLHPPRAARIADVAVTEGMRVDVGQELVRLDVPDIEHELRTLKARLDLVQAKLARVSADGTDRDERLVLQSNETALQRRMAGLYAERAALVVAAPKSGVATDLMPGLQAGRWVGVKEPLLLIRGADGAVVSGYVPGSDVWRIEPGATGRFVADAPLGPSFAVKLVSIAASSAETLDIVELASTNGGRVEARTDGRQRIVPAAAQYRVVLDPQDNGTMTTGRRRGVVHVTGQGQSYLASLWRQILRVVVRESGA